MKDGAGSNEPNSRDNLGRNAGVISDVLNRKFIRKESKHRGTKADEEIGAQSGWPMLQLAFQSDQAAQYRREHQAHDRDPNDGIHLSLQNPVDVVPIGHERGGWLDFITGKRRPDALLN